MADQPTPKKEQTAITPELGEALSKWEALKQSGWIKPIDYLFILGIAATWFTMLVYYLVGYPSVYTLISAAVFTTLVMQVWNVILQYRSMDFILVTRADINLMPIAAARMALGYFQAGQTPSR